MEITDNDLLQPFIDLIDRYNSSFYNKDIEAFRSLHIDDESFVFYDNHSGCDSESYSVHEKKVQSFFENGHITELKKENIRVFSTSKMACITLILRYSNTPKPGVRTTFVVESISGSWKIRHMHHSFNPNESRQ